MTNINFTPNDILKKDFSKKMHGYDPTEVDEFLDQIIKDYENFDKVADELEQKNANLVQENKSLTAEVNQLKQKVASADQQDAVNDTPKDINPYLEQPTANPVVEKQPAEPQPETVTNIDILKRLNKLERKVYGENGTN